MLKTEATERSRCKHCNKLVSIGQQVYISPITGYRTRSHRRYYESINRDYVQYHVTCIESMLKAQANRLESIAQTV